MPETPARASTNGSSPPQTLSEIGRYSLLSKIGEGGMAEVYLAEVRGAAGFTRPVALKVIRSELASNPDFRRWFTREGLIGAHLAHPNIVGTLDFGEDGERLYMVMELVEGPSLDQVIRAHIVEQLFIPPAIALELTLQLLRALSQAHCSTALDGRVLKTVHCDLKPSNILLSRHGQARITDFGIARAIGEHFPAQNSHVFRGTALYMSPEQADGVAQLDARSDLFSLGLILFELLTLTPLYERGSLPNLLRQARLADVGHRLELLHQLPDGDGRIKLLTRALQLRVEERFADARAFGQAVTDCLNRQPRTHDLPSWAENATARAVPGWLLSLRSAEGTVRLAEATLPPAASRGPAATSLPDMSLSAFQGEAGTGIAPTLISPSRSVLPTGTEVLSDAKAVATSPHPQSTISPGETTAAVPCSEPLWFQRRKQWKTLLMVLPLGFAGVIGFILWPSTRNEQKPVATTPSRPSTSQGEAISIQNSSIQNSRGAETEPSTATPSQALSVNKTRAASIPIEKARSVPTNPTRKLPTGRTPAPPPPHASTITVQTLEGTLVLNSRPSASLLVDGVQVGDTSQRSQSRQVAAGRHELQFISLKDKAELRTTVEVQPGKKQSCVAYFQTSKVDCQEIP